MEIALFQVLVFVLEIGQDPCVRHLFVHMVAQDTENAIPLLNNVIASLGTWEQIVQYHFALMDVFLKTDFVLNQIVVSAPILLLMIPDR